MAVSPFEMKQILGRDPTVVVVGRSDVAASLSSILSDGGLQIDGVMHDPDEASFALERDGIVPDGIVIDKGCISDPEMLKIAQGLDRQLGVTIFSSTNEEFPEMLDIQGSSQSSGERISLFNLAENLLERISSFNSSPRTVFQAS